MNADSIVSTLANVIGDEFVLTTRDDQSSYTRDWTGVYSGKAIAVVRPVSTAEVSELVKVCAANNVAIIAQGGNTGLAGGGVPSATQERPVVIISLERMKSVRGLNVKSRTATIEAGMILAGLQQHVLEFGLTFPLTFGAKGSCTLGGNLATNAGGSNVVRYGNTRDLVLGIEAVMPDGSILNALSGLHKNNTGYDLRHLLIGSEGTLGIITAAVVKLVPIPLACATAFVATPDIETALKLLHALQDQTGGMVEAFEYMPGDLVELICKHNRGMRAPLDNAASTGIMIEIASTQAVDADIGIDGITPLTARLESILSEYIDQELVLDAMIASSEQQRLDLWRMREAVLESLLAEGPVRLLDIALPLDKVGDFLARMNKQVRDANLRPFTVSHLGDGNIHYALAPLAGEEPDNQTLDSVERVAYDLVAEYAGSFSAEHGIGESKRGLLAERKDPTALMIMRQIKAAVDPNNIMNPNRLLH